MKNVVDSRHHKTDYPLYLQKAPEQRRAPSGNPWDSLARLTKATASGTGGTLYSHYRPRAP